MAAVKRPPLAVQPVEVVVGAIDSIQHQCMVVFSALKPLFTKATTEATQQINATSPLQALTVAAIALPGLIIPVNCSAEEEEVDFQYGHYQEGKRDLYTIRNDRNPIEVDTLLGKAKFSLSDRIKFAFNYTQDTWSGATPITTAPLVQEGNRNILANTTTKPRRTITTGASPFLTGNILLNKDFLPVNQNNKGRVTGINTQVVHTLSTASPETRKQGDFRLGYEWDEAALDIGGGLSVENDYESRFGSINTRWDFNQKLTTLNFGLSYTNSNTSAIFDHDASPYITKTAFANQITQLGSMKILRGNRQDWASSLSLTQVLNKSALIVSDIGYTRSAGYMENPYKAMTIVFVDPEQRSKYLTGSVQAFLEQRPDQRNQFSMGSRYIQHIDTLNAALHLGYHFFHDDWGINAHTFDADWVQPIGNTWSITPRVRYYSQEAADFYSPYLLSKQAFSKAVYDKNTGRFSIISYNAALLPANFSSDQRLSGFGALSGGVTISKQFSKAISLETGFEYYTHAGALKLGGSGEGNYADFNSYFANAALKVNLSALNTPGSSNHAEHHHHSHSKHKADAPAGVMFDHLLDQAGAVMLGYRFMYGRQSGELLHHSHAVNDLDIVNNGCDTGKDRCRLVPTYMNMNMHMLDLMVALTDWLNLMVMPQFMDMDMNLRSLSGAPPVPPGGHVHTGTGHATGGIGDTGIYALIKLLNIPVHHLHLGVGVSAPTGDVDIKLRRNHQQDEGHIHYGMQLGSGTWDFKPSLTYTGKHDDWFWGAQMNATKRLETRNATGFAFGDIFQTTAWTGYNLTHWLSASVRGAYTVQGGIHGRFDATPGVINGKLINDVNPKSGPMDFPGSYGGRYWDLGLGLNAVVPSGVLAGNRFGFEWLQPIISDVNGYQLNRDGALSASWSIMF